MAEAIGDAAFLDAVARLLFCNPFLPERVDAERAALGDAYVDLGRIWHFDGTVAANPNLEAIDSRLDALLPSAALRLSRASERFKESYRDAAFYRLFTRYAEQLFALTQAPSPAARRLAPFFSAFERDAQQLLYRPELGLAGDLPPIPRLFAWFFQVRRAFHTIFRSIVGRSPAAVELRASVWQSVFTHDMRRYRDGLYRAMGDMTTLITGPSGTGKELVARAIGLSRYIPFDAGRRAFHEDPREAFFAVNLTALSPTLIESELFGHQRGAFTGAIKDHPGWFEVCPPLGAVFLDEIGEITESIQVKLLRVLQTRTFQRLGDTRERRFEGKLIAATNRDPATAMASGRMREDFYYRLCSDRIRTPALRSQLEGDSAELDNLVAAIVARLFTDDPVPELAGEICAQIRSDLGEHYAWPGNFRELEQCIRNIVIRGHYHPEVAETEDTDGLLQAVAAGSLTADALLTRYVELVYRQAGSLVQAGKRLGLDRRTVKARVEAARTDAR